MIKQIAYPFVALGYPHGNKVTVANILDETQVYAFDVEGLLLKFVELREDEYCVQLGYFYLHEDILKLCTLTIDKPFQKKQIESDPSVLFRKDITQISEDNYPNLHQNIPSIEKIYRVYENSYLF